MPRLSSTETSKSSSTTYRLVHAIENHADVPNIVQSSEMTTPREIPHQLQNPKPKEASVIARNESKTFENKRDAEVAAMALLSSSKKARINNPHSSSSVQHDQSNSSSYNHSLPTPNIQQQPQQDLLIAQISDRFNECLKQVELKYNTTLNLVYTSLSSNIQNLQTQISNMQNQIDVLNGQVYANNNNNNIISNHCIQSNGTTKKQLPPHHNITLTCTHILTGGHNTGIHIIADLKFCGHTFLVSAAYEDTLKVWNMNECCQIIQNINGNSITPVNSANNKTIATADELFVTEEKNGIVYSIAIYNDVYLAAGSKDGIIKLWRMVNNTQKTHDSNDDNDSSNYDKNTDDEDTSTFASFYLIGTLGRHEGAVYALAVFQQQYTQPVTSKRWIMASGSGDKWIKIWDLTKNTLLKKIYYGANVNMLEMYAPPPSFKNNDNNMVNLVVGDSNDLVNMSICFDFSNDKNKNYNKKKTKLSHETVEENGFAESVVFFHCPTLGQIPNARTKPYLASGHNSVIKLWDLSESSSGDGINDHFSYCLVGILRGHKGGVKALSVFTHGGSGGNGEESSCRAYLMSGCDEKIMVWDVLTQSVVFMIKCDSPVQCLRLLSPAQSKWRNDVVLVSSHWDQKIRVWKIGGIQGAGV